MRKPNLKIFNKLVSKKSQKKKRDGKYDKEVKTMRDRLRIFNIQLTGVL